MTPTRSGEHGSWLSEKAHGADIYTTDMVQGLTDAYARLVAMKLFGERAIDYVRSASADDRRYLLFNPVTKMKVTTEGERVTIAIGQRWCRSCLRGDLAMRARRLPGVSLRDQRRTKPHRARRDQATVLACREPKATLRGS